MRVIQALLWLTGTLLIVPAGAHDKPLDSYGCHANVAHGSYHCHRGPLAGKEYKSKEDMLHARLEREREERQRARARHDLPAR